MKVKTRKTKFELFTGKSRYTAHNQGIKTKPISEFITFKHAQTLLKHDFRGSTEGLLKNGSIRWIPVSPDHGMARMIYKPDVMVMVEALGVQD